MKDAVVRIEQNIGKNRVRKKRGPPIALRWVGAETDASDPGRDDDILIRGMLGPAAPETIPYPGTYLKAVLRIEDSDGFLAVCKGRFGCPHVRRHAAIQLKLEIQRAPALP